MNSKYRELNATSVFLLPLLEIPKEVFRGRLVNAFIYDQEVDSYKEGHIFVVHSNRQDKNFGVFEKYLEERDTFVNSYDIVDTHYGVKVFKLDEKYADAYKAFKSGKYSSYDLIARGSCFKFGMLEDNRVLHHVFTKSEKLRQLKEISLGMNLAGNQELWSIWSEKFDVLTPDIKEYLRKMSKVSSIESNTEFLNES